MGTLDRLLQVLIVLTIVILYAMNLISGIAALILGVVALVFLVTSLFGYCPLYKPFRISTRK